MSNHSGSYMLNSVLETANDMGILKKIGKKKTQEFILEVLDIARHYDCNPGEILEGIGQECGVCSCCSSASDDIDEEGLCPKCR